MQGNVFAMRQLQSNPKKVVDGGRRGIKQDLIILSNLWLEMAPELLKMDLLSVFFGHLDPSLVPVSNGSRTSLNSSLVIDRAWISLIALTKLGNIIIPLHPQISLPTIESQTLKAWPGVYKWCNFIYNSRITTGTIPPDVRRTAMDIVGGIIYSLGRSEGLRKAIIDTPGIVELVTRTWVMEDAITTPSNMPIPVNTAAFDTLLHFTNWDPPAHQEIQLMRGPLAKAEIDRLDALFEAHEENICANLDRVIAAAGGDASHVVSLTFSRLRTATAVSERIHEPHTALTLNLIGHLSRSPTHPLRLGFLSQGMTSFVTKLAVVIVGMLDVIAAAESSGRKQIGFGAGGHSMLVQRSHTHQQGLLDSLVASLAFLNNTLDSTDGFTWVAKAVAAGLLQAWAGAARHIHKLDNREDAEMIIEILDKIIPKYLVYKSVVNLVNGSIKKVKNDMKIEQWRDPETRKVWTTFEKMALERYTIAQRMKVMKAAACDNYAKCHNIDLKNNFMKCSGCNNTLYCSRECQKYSWKEGGHKLVCKLKQQEFLEGKLQSISKADTAYFHHLATSDARSNLPSLKKLAESIYPALAKSLTSLVINIDYMVYPPKLGLHPLAEHEKYSPRHATDVSPNSEQRNDELVQRARDHPGEYGIIQSRMANGQGIQLVLSIVPGTMLEDEGCDSEEIQT